mmetsp:Transcript_14384/g.29801  ORF Transcript_14384/g.29801 Transcript_14384/m.29801 type:complete len:235 (-) Transcript_14384:112-816(-)
MMLMGVTAVVSEVTLPVRSADVGSAACEMMLFARSAGGGAAALLGSGRITKLTMTDPAVMEVTLMRLCGTPAAFATSFVNELTNVVRSGEPGGMAVMSCAMVMATSAGGGTSTMAAAGLLALVVCPPPLHAVPTVRTTVPINDCPRLATRVQMTRAPLSLRLVHGMLADAVRKTPDTSDWLMPKFSPKMVMVAGGGALLPVAPCTMLGWISVMRGAENLSVAVPCANRWNMPLW